MGCETREVEWVLGGDEIVVYWTEWGCESTSAGRDAFVASLLGPALDGFDLVAEEIESQRSAGTPLDGKRVYRRRGAAGGHGPCPRCASPLRLSSGLGRRVCETCHRAGVYGSPDDPGSPAPPSWLERIARYALPISWFSGAVVGVAVTLLLAR